ncbi:MAG: hypothetical protein OEV78_08525 [Spirochaetia bacterium]|nr:hypothetical protein [Spirochaetia bacterium]
MKHNMMILKDKKKYINIEKTGENLSIKFLKKRMKKLDVELGSMSGFVFSLRSKINHHVRSSIRIKDERNEKSIVQNPAKSDQSGKEVYT